MVEPFEVEVLMWWPEVHYLISRKVQLSFQDSTCMCDIGVWDESLFRWGAKTKIEQILFLLDKFCVGDAFYHELIMTIGGLPGQTVLPTLV